jgi:hypothetical protein
MTTSARSRTSGPKLSGRVVDVHVTDDELLMRLEDGRMLGVPLAWLPRLLSATPEQRNNWKLMGHGLGIHWPDIDEDLVVENLLGAEGELLMARGSWPDQGTTQVLYRRARGRPRMNPLPKMTTAEEATGGDPASPAPPTL